ncbi:conserved hypothetical protein [Desulfarculus baarsii DSM 2075]|uniref:Thioredoxin-like fold domain-containing protein n=1 Tax=Desulfarculus baarsii (strain ATCC 33931 / DSM 2075 / LMG 7858 / VKM B-1802 / 2st14) TaxID=644282 RepID=E1QJ87_DESB2|nr:thioredoxin family protein [Desulfarculus baarsii]ADK85630.1 conserved hypothetical protein [Desulfarculus baarsii DSM 2075]
MEDVRLIGIDGRQVGLRGLDQAVSEMADDWAARSDAEVGAELLRRLSPINYIPARARQAHERALAAHFRRALGGQVGQSGAPGLEVRILGLGCAQCHRLTQLAMRAAAELGLAADVEHVDDLRRIGQFGVIGAPALVINGRAVWVGSVPPYEKIKQWLAQGCERSGQPME